VRATATTIPSDLREVHPELAGVGSELDETLGDLRALSRGIHVVSEALTNVAKHANASAVKIDVDTDDRLVRLAIRDDGVGGADPARGSGLIGLKDRVEGTGGTLRVESHPGAHLPPGRASDRRRPVTGRQLRQATPGGGHLPGGRLTRSPRPPSPRLASRSWMAPADSAALGRNPMAGLAAISSA
jgi:hypothetical protein